MFNWGEHLHYSYNSPLFISKLTFWTFIINFLISPKKFLSYSNNNFITILKTPAKKNFSHHKKVLMATWRKLLRHNRKELPSSFNTYSRCTLANPFNNKILSTKIFLTHSRHHMQICLKNICTNFIFFYYMAPV